jgi:dTDP-4-dehydrorhamnose 3,5-epimerase
VPDARAGEELAKNDLYCAMQVTLTELPGVLVLKPRYFQDSRGYFVETYNARTAHEIGLKVDFVQDNQAFSIQRGTVRALHFQVPPRPQAKLVRVLRGSIYDVAVDLRTGSPTYGRWMAATLTAQGGEQVFVPRGFAHGYCTLEDNTEVVYKVDSYYAPECEQGIAWNDPTLAIGWPVAPGEAVLSDKDRKLFRFGEFVSPFRYREG